MSTETALARPDTRPNGTPGSSILAPVRVDTQSISLPDLANALSKSGYFKDARDASQAVVKVLYGQELGIPPVSAMMGIHIIEGKPAPSANLLAAIIKKSGVYSYRVRKRTDTECEIEFFERGESLGTNAWTIRDAERAGLAGRGTWKAYPRQMLFNRCMADGVRVYCPDLFGGAPVYTPEELGAEVDSSGEPLGLAALTPPPAAPAAPPSRQVNPATGEVIENPGQQRAHQAVTSQETSTYREATGASQPATLADLQNACKDLLRKLGYPAPDKPREYFAAVLEREIKTLRDLQLADWQALRGALEAGTVHRARAMAAWKEFCGAFGLDRNDRAERLRVWGQLLQVSLETSGVLTPEQWRYLADVLQARAAEELARQEAGRQQVAVPAEVVDAANAGRDPFEE